MSGSKSISVDGQTLEVTSNLYFALQQLRRGSEDIRLWIDAICVNQSDLLECSDQVQLMLQIYSLAKETSVWLGVQGRGSEDTIRNLEAAALLREKVSRSAVDQAEKGTLLKQANSLVLYVHPLIIDLLSRRWWSRVWVIQEVAVSESVKLYYGPSTITWEHLQSPLEHFRAGDALLPVFLYVKPHCVQKALDQVDSLENARNAFRSRDMTSFLKLLFNHRSAKATDSRDKVVAVTGLVIPSATWACYHDRAYNLSFQYTCLRSPTRDSSMRVPPRVTSILTSLPIGCTCQTYKDENYLDLPAIQE